MKKEQKEIAIQGQSYSLLINRKNIKNSYLRVDEEKRIVVNTHYLTPLESILKLVHMHEEKILKVLQKIENRTLCPNQMAYLGKIYSVSFMKMASFDYKIENNHILIYMSQAMDEELGKETFYKSLCQEVFSQRLIACVAEFNKQFSVTLPELEIRKMKRRYGTCYYKKHKIILNLFLMKYSLETIDYVIYHELTHFLVPNHSKTFYQILKRVIPNYKEIKINLNKF